jgi:hypothetical protein
VAELRVRGWVAEKHAECGPIRLVTNQEFDWNDGVLSGATVMLESGRIKSDDGHHVDEFSCLRLLDSRPL